MKDLIRLCFAFVALCLMAPADELKACDIFSSVGVNQVFSSSVYPVQSVAVNAGYASPTFIQSYAAPAYNNQVAVVNSFPSQVRSFNVVSTNPVIRFNQFVPTGVAVRNIAFANNFHGNRVFSVNRFGNRVFARGNRVFAVNNFHGNRVFAVNAFGRRGFRSRVFGFGGFRSRGFGVSAFGNRFVGVRRGLFGASVVRVR